MVFWTKGALPILGAAQVKHHRTPKVKTGAGDIRDMAGALQMHPFQLGIVVTNTTFTPDAKWVADNHPNLLRLRDGEDLKLWIQDEFTENERWLPTPTKIEICRGVTIEVPVFR